MRPLKASEWEAAYKASAESHPSAVEFVRRLVRKPGAPDPFKEVREAIARIGEVKGPDVAYLAPDTPPEVAETLRRWGEATDEERGAAKAYARKKLNEREGA